MRTRAVRDGDDWVLNGAEALDHQRRRSRSTTRSWRSPTPTRARKGISAFVVEQATRASLRRAGAQARHQGVADPRALLRRLRIPATGSSAARARASTALRTLDHTRVTIGAQAVGIAQGALDYAIGYVKERQQFGKAVAEFQGMQFMLADMAMKLEAARQLVYVAAAKSERGDADLTFFGAAAKCFASDVAMEVTTDAVQLLGGYGYVKDYPVERMMRDAKITQIYEGTNQIQRLVMARQLLK